VGLSEFPVGTMRHYSDANCTTPTTVATIPNGQTDIDYYVKPLTGGASTQIATASFGSTQRQFPAVIGAVRRGTCNFAGPINLADGGQTVDTGAFCTITPPHQSMGKTALFFQATTSSGSGGTAGVRCRLTATNQVGCIRVDGQSGGVVAWQTVELPTALRVERVSGSCQPPPFNITLPAAVSPSSSFLLKSFNTSSGDIDDEDLFTTQLTSGTNIIGDLGDDATMCSGSSFEVQAVELQGLTVTRGTFDAGLPSGESIALVTALPAASLNTAVLTQHRVPNLNPALSCSVFVRADLPSASSIGFSRNLGMDGGCVDPPIYQLIWERLDFGTRGNVQAKTVTLPIGTSTLAVPISPVDITRTIVFASSQAASGQSCGETNYAGGTSYLGEGNARFELTTSTNVQVSRQRNGGVGVFTFFVVELDP